MNLISWVFGKRQPYNTNEILNNGLDMSMAFGKYYMRPIQSRLKRHYRALSEDELSHYNKTCQEAREYGRKELYSYAESHDEMMHESKFNSVFSKQYPWATPKVLKHVYKQGRYYVRHDFGRLPESTSTK